MDEPHSLTPGLPPAPGLTLIELSAWIGALIDNWESWHIERGGDEEWLSWPTRNERFPTLGHLFLHAFSPMHRYADQVAGEEPADDGHLNANSWVGLHTWAHQCQQRHHAVCVTLASDHSARLLEFRTRSAGTLSVTVAEALTHACTHCFWHLGGIAHLLRLGNVDPPQRSDLIFWAMQRHPAANEPEDEG